MREFARLGQVSLLSDFAILYALLPSGGSRLGKGTSEKCGSLVVSQQAPKAQHSVKTGIAGPRCVRPGEAVTGCRDGCFSG